MRNPWVLCAGVILAAPLALAAPRDRPDGSWISLGGTVASTGPDAFNLDYGTGTVLVEMDDRDTFPEGQALVAGDRVTVYGRVDDDLFEATKIEAASVYVDSVSTYYVASSRDEEDAAGAGWFDLAAPLRPAAMLVRGTVTATGEDAFTLGQGGERIVVDTSQLADAPFDDAGWRRVDTGDLVRVRGLMTSEFLADGKLVAGSVVTLLPHELRR
jgi:hypothetical protein